ncbi:MAG: LemA family protein [Candidatus Micrarchaeota archaeon]|nr:LemA family protein [Candidatus Micrarchaeota archaeon]
MFLLLSLLGWVALAVVAVIIIVVLVIIGGYNNLIGLRNRVQDAQAQIDVQLKRRFDLIPNLVNSVKGYMKYEQNVLTTVTKLRSSIVSGSMQDKAQANNQISQALKTIFAVAENYPDLKASQNFKQLQDELTDTEDKISFVRTSYNDYVLDYNNAIQTFPGSVFASSFHFQKAEFFQAPAEAAEPVQVNFDDVNAPQKPAAAQAAPAAPQKQPRKGSGRKRKAQPQGK